MSDQSKINTSRLPPPPSTPRELMTYPQRKPDWVDELAMSCAMAAVRAAREQMIDAITPHLAGIEKAVFEGFDRVDASTAEIKKELTKHSDAISTLQLAYSKQRDELEDMKRRLSNLEEIIRAAPPSERA